MLCKRSDHIEEFAINPVLIKQLSILLAQCVCTTAFSQTHAAPWGLPQLCIEVSCFLNFSKNFFSHAYSGAD